MRNRNKELNSLFRDTLDFENKTKWDNICKNYSLDLMLDLFIWWVSSRERYLKTNKFAAGGIITKLECRKNISRVKNCRVFYELFPLFYEFYLKNKYSIQDLFCGDIYDKKKNNLKKYSDLEKIFEWQNFLEQDDSKQANDYLNKLKYLYRIFPENELLYIFNLYINSAYKLHNLSSWYEDLLKWKKPFDIVIKDLDDSILKKFENIWGDNIHIINSLFSRYLHVLKYNKKLRNNLSEDTLNWKNIQNQTKTDLYEDLDSQVVNIISVRTKYGWSENVDYVDWDPVAPIRDYMEGDDTDDI